MDNRLFEKETLRELDSIHNQIKKLKGELFQLKYGITREDDFYQNIINKKEPVVIFFCSGERDIVTIENNFRHCLVVHVADGSHLIVQKSSLKYITF